jgi:hypothetical protein
MYECLTVRSSTLKSHLFGAPKVLRQEALLPSLSKSTEFIAALYRATIVIHSPSTIVPSSESNTHATPGEAGLRISNLSLEVLADLDT